MPSKQSDRLKKLLGMKEKRVPDMVREREMNDVRNYNRNQQARVIENEKRQVARYADTKAPETAKDIGSTFKLQVYTLKLQGILQQKKDAIQQVELVIGTANRTLPDGTVEITLGASQMRDARLAPYVNTIFGKAEVLNTFNEMMSFIKTYMPDVFSDDYLRDTVYTAYFTPLSEALVATAGQFPPLYDTLQVRDARNPDGSRPNEAQLEAMAQARGLSQRGENDYRAKTIFRQQAIQVYSLLMACAENINIQALRPVTAKDVDEYERSNDVEDIITTRGRPVVPGPAPLPPGQSILPEDRPEPPGDAPPPPPGPPTPAPQPPQQQPQQGQPAQQGQRADLNSTVQALLAFEQANPAGVRRPLMRAEYRADPNRDDGGRGLRQAFRAWNDLGIGQGNRFPPPTAQLLADGIRAINQQRQQQQQQQQQQQPAPAPLGRQFTQQQQAYYDAGGTEGAIQGATLAQLPTLNQAQNEEVWNIYRRLEVDGGRVIPPNQAGARQLYNALPQDIQNTLRRQQPDGSFDIDADTAQQDDIIPWIQRIQQIRVEWGRRNNTRSEELYGLGRQRNAKAFLRGCGVPEDIIGTAMMRHGLPDNALVEDLEGSGILDTLKDFAGSVADSASGWFDTIKANMPTMSDVRRAVGKIVPDSFQDYVPSGLKRTFGDKAKDFFGFGMSGGEFQADPHRSTATRHREPFDNFFDNRGYRQGAVQRMTTMFVPDWELSSGLNRLKGGDQLADHDIELLRRQDHHDVSLYKPAVIQQPIHGYGHDGDEDSQYEGGLKQRLSRALAPDVISRPYRKDPMLVHRVEDHDEFQPKDIFNGLAHYEELEKPADMDEDPNPFRVRTENHKVNTGKMKKVTYHTK